MLFSCAYCDWFRRRAVTLFVSRQEHLHVLSDEWLEDRSKPLSVKDQAAIIRLEEQAEEFLHAVLCRKCKPLIPCSTNPRSVSLHCEDNDLNGGKIVKCWLDARPNNRWFHLNLFCSENHIAYRLIFLWQKLTFFKLQKLTFFLFSFFFFFTQMCRISQTRTSLW